MEQRGLYLTVLTAEARDVVRAEPFEAIERQVGLLLEGDEQAP